MVYVHVPFCRSFCIYCDFYSESFCNGREREKMERYAQLVCEEIGFRRSELLAAQELNTLYIGGGTPSVLPLDLLSRIVEALSEAGISGPFEEFTVEVNPDDIVQKGPGYVRGLIELGVNRVSMGVQSLDDGILHWMNRRHDADTARRAFGILREAGLDNISVDLIFGVSGMSDECLRKTVEELVAWRPEHISAYQLSVEDGTPLHGQLLAGRYSELADEECARQYDFLCGRLAAGGYGHYEISNWALPGCEAKHNSAYWSRLPYVGLGPGAHSFDGKRRRSWNSEGIDGWALSGETLDEAEIREESIMLGLRTAKGIPESHCRAEDVETLLSEGLLCRLPDENLRIPENRFFVADGIIAELV